MNPHIEPTIHRRRATLSGLVIFLLPLLVALACNFPGMGVSTPTQPGLLLTSAAQTLRAQLTIAAIQITATPLPIVETATPLPENPTETPTTPEPPAETATPTLCDRAGFVTDVNYPDNTSLAPGTAFVKTWRLKNTGTCTWDNNYAIVFDHGDAMEGPASAPMPVVVVPGQEVDISVSLKAPEAPAVYQGYWKLRNAAGQVFGLGVNADKYFWVKIKVEAP